MNSAKFNFKEKCFYAVVVVLAVADLAAIAWVIKSLKDLSAG